MNKNFTPESQLNVIRRYLHILSLLQNSSDPIDWNSTSLADAISLDEPDTVLSDKTVRDYIKKYLVENFQLDVFTEKGGRKTAVITKLTEDLQLKLAQVYTNFITSDFSKDQILKRFISKHPNNALWFLGKIYFAILKKNQINFDYMPHKRKRSFLIELLPYHLVFKNNNFYLVGMQIYNRRISLFLMNKIESLTVIENYVDYEIPPVDDIFKSTMGSFIGTPIKVAIRFTSNIYSQIDEIICCMNPIITEKVPDEIFEAEFNITDDLFLCRQIFLFGKEAEIISPPELREKMRNLLDECRDLYK